MEIFTGEYSIICDMDIRSFFISLSKLCSPQSLAWIFVSSLAIILIGYTVLLVVDKNRCDKRRYKIYYLFLIGLTGTQVFIFLCASSQTISVRNILAVVVIEFLYSLFLRVAYSLSLRVVRVVKGRKKRERPTIDLRSFIPEKDYFDRTFNSGQKKNYTARENDGSLVNNGFQLNDGIESRESVQEPLPSNAKEGLTGLFGQERQPQEKTENPLNATRRNQTDADYSHVKNIIERLSFYELNAQEKKLVGELNTYVNRAENGEDTFSLKEKISDGLGGLLKIMAKYNL